MTPLSPTIERTVEITNVNIRVEKHGEEDVLAADVKVACRLGITELLPMFVAPDLTAEQLKAMFWTKKGDPFSMNKHVLRLDYKAPGLRFEISDDGPAITESGEPEQRQVYVTRDARLVKPVLHFVSGTFEAEVEMTIQCALSERPELSEAQSGVLCGCLGRMVRIRLEPLTEDLLED
jgi:hypothetical protein